MVGTEPNIPDTLITGLVVTTLESNTLGEVSPLCLNSVLVAISSEVIVIFFRIVIVKNFLQQAISSSFTSGISIPKRPGMPFFNITPVLLSVTIIALSSSSSGLRYAGLLMWYTAKIEDLTHAAIAFMYASICFLGASPTVVSFIFNAALISSNVSIELNLPY